MNGDNAFVANLEFRAPALSFVKLFSKKESKYKYKDGLQFLVFGDYGVVSNHKNVPTLGDTGYLLGVGPGLRYTFGPFFSARLDWGFQLHHIVQDHHSNRGHFSMELSY